MAGNILKNLLKCQCSENARAYLKGCVRLRWSCPDAASTSTEAGNFVVRADFIRAERARIESHFVELALEIEHPVITSADEDLAGRPGAGENACDFRLGAAVEMHAHLLAFA